MKETTLKALVHGALAVITAAEAITATSRSRKLLLGAALGWHLHATFYHAVLEKEEARCETRTN